MVEITAFQQERIFQPMRALEFIIGHMVYNQLILESYRRQTPLTKQRCSKVLIAIKAST
jgi:hypothetical protein